MQRRFQPQDVAMDPDPHGHAGFPSRPLPPSQEDFDQLGVPLRLSHPQVVAAAYSTPDRSSPVTCSAEYPSSPWSTSVLC